MSRILILANNDVGLYKFRKELIQEMLARGNDVYIALPYGECISKLVEYGCAYFEMPIDRRGINPTKDLKLLKQMYQIIKQAKPDLIVTYTIKPNIYGGFLARTLHIRYVTNITGLGTAFQSKGILQKAVRFMYRYSLGNASMVFFENAANQKTFIDMKLVKEQQTHQLNGAGVNLAEYPISPYPQAGTIRFLFIGRIMKEKGIEELLYTAARLKQENANVQFDVLGFCEEAYTETLNAHVESGILIYHGFQSDVFPFIQKAHCFILPSYHEGMANTLLETASVGRPLITTDIAGCREAVLEGQNGFTCKPRDSEDLYQVVKRFIDLPHECKEEMGLISRQHMENTFDKRAIVNETLGVMQLS